VLSRSTKVLSREVCKRHHAEYEAVGLQGVLVGLSVLTCMYGCSGDDRASRGSSDRASRISEARKSRATGTEATGIYDCLKISQIDLSLEADD
jgi:hypothetical protein